MVNNAEIDPVNGPTPQRWTAKRKAAIVLEIIKGKTTSAEVARQHGLTVADVEGWIERAQFGMEEFLKALPKEVEERHTSEKKELLAKIGDLSMQVDVLKKANGFGIRNSAGETD
jgi:transposase-like protein